MTLRQLLGTPHTRGHIRKRNLEVYVRVQPLLLEGLVRPTITIADFQMVDLSEDKLQASFLEWFRESEAVAKEYKMSLAFENAGGWPWMEKFLALHHFVRRVGHGTDPRQLDAYRLYRETL